MKIILADDHALFRDALAHYIERAEMGTTIYLAQDIHGVVEHLDAHDDIDLILLDLRMPGMNGVQGIEKLRLSRPDIPIVLLSGVAEESDIRAAMDVGANGFFPKTMSGKAMLQGIHKVLEGETFLPVDHNTDTFMPSYYGDMPPPSNDLRPVPEEFAQLTPREKQVLDFLMQGVSNKEIAQSLDLQVVTVKLHVRGICRKLGAKNRTQAALLAQQMGMARTS